MDNDADIPSEPPPRPCKRLCKRLVAAFLLFWLLPSLCAALTEEEKNHIAIYRSTAKGVVNITSIEIAYDFFLRLTPHEGAGSGIVLDKQGHVLTNNHVIKDAHRLEVTLWDQSRFRAKLVGAFPDYDLAVIQIQAPQEKLHPLELGESSQLMVGQKVLAIGNPFGMGVTLTTGVISSLGRSVRAHGSVLLEDLIQTDASINPGNSGGPLLDSRGRVIGVNTAIFSPTGASVGIGFAVPADAVRRIVPDLIANGRVRLPWLGVQVFSVSGQLAQLLNLGVDHGALIIKMYRGQPAHQAGLQGPTRRVRIGNTILPLGGDVIVGLDKHRIENSDDFIRTLRKFRPGQTIQVTVVRSGRGLAVPVELGEKPEHL